MRSSKVETLFDSLKRFIAEDSTEKKRSQLDLPWFGTNGQITTFSRLGNLEHTTVLTYKVTRPFEVFCGVETEEFFRNEMAGAVGSFNRNFNLFIAQYLRIASVV